MSRCYRYGVASNRPNKASILLAPSPLADKLRLIHERVVRAAERSGRPSQAVTLVAVTKTRSLDEVEAALALGLTDLGESRIQEAIPKMEALAGTGARWHLIGHLQTNKVKRAVGAFSLIHGVESWALAEAISGTAAARGQVQPVLVQVNVSREASKYGISPSEAQAFVRRVATELPGLRVEGLMTMAPRTSDPENSRTPFRQLRELRDTLATPEHPLPTLSMGTSQDYGVAVEEGATHIRIGTELFGERQSPA